MHILFAEDSMMLAKPVIEALEKEGHRVTHVQNGSDAIARFMEGPPDLVLMDIVMPGMDGIEATRRIKALPTKNWIPVTMLTGLSSDEDMIKGLEAGADDYITKPVDFNVLIARMRSKQRIVDMQNSFFGVLDNVHEGILTIDSRGTIQRFNLAAEKIFGFSAAEVLGRNVNVLMPEPYHSAHDGYLTNYIESRQPKVIGIGRKVQGRRKDGTIFPMHLAVTQVESAFGLHFIGLVRDITQEESDRQRIEFLALHDSLTGLSNRASFNIHLSTCVEGNTPFALLFIDIDGFKPVNDTYGHDVGDAVLKEIAQRLRTACTEEAFIARLGGDEFVVLFKKAAVPAAAEKLAAEIIRQVNLPMPVGDVTCHVGASIGTALFPMHAKTHEGILNAADQAMYAAKKSGKNQAVSASNLDA